LIAIIGILVVLGSVLGGFALAGGPIPVLFVVAEYIVIGGTAVGTLLISTPTPVFTSMLRKTRRIFTGHGFREAVYLDGLKMLYELFQLARRDGLAAIEDHIEHPDSSSIFQRYEAVTRNHHAITYLCDSLRLVLVGSVPPHDLEMLMDAEIDVHLEAESKPVEALVKVSDALPGIGIVAAVLGIVITMQSLAGPVEEIGHHVASALVGTFLGILLAYGFVAPIAANIEAGNQAESRFYYFLKAAVVGFSKGLAPIVAVEFARRAIFADDRPTFDEMEQACKEVTARMRGG
jgi:chemotaxis protein MotA